MNGAFDDQFAGDSRARIDGRDSPGIVAACADFPTEAIVIGAILADDDVFDTAADKLREEDFADPLFGEIFAVVRQMRGANEVASPITVARRLDRHETLNERGGAGYLAKLAAAEGKARAPGHIDHLVELARRRYLHVALQEVAPDIADTGRPVPETAAKLEMALSAALFWTTARPAIAVADAWDDAIRHVSDLQAGRADKGIVIPGLTEWNDICGGGLFMSQLILLGGRPGMGKTAVALGVAWRTAAAGHGVLFITLEMSVEQLMARLVADLMFEACAPATMNDVTQGNFTPRDYEIATEIRERIADWPMVIERPTAGLTAAGVAPLIRRHKRMMAQKGKELRLVVVDYLGLLAPTNRRQNREQEMSDTSREMKNIAVVNGVAVLALAQLNRAVEQRDDKRPVMSDLRDSGSLEQDADTIVFAYRPEYYLTRPGAEPPIGDKKREAWETEMTAERNRLHLYSAKVRQGEPTKRHLYFFGNRQAVRSDDFYRTGGGPHG